MKGKYIKGRIIKYDGTQLRPLWCFKEFDLKGDCVVAFRGPCDIQVESMVDVEDVKDGSVISSGDMLHFLAEVFDLGLESTVLLQRLLVQTVIEVIKEFGMAQEVKREASNIFVKLEGDSWGKLSISVATVSPVSGLIHLGLNITTAGTPVETAGLSEMGLSRIDDFAVGVLRRFVDEFRRVRSDMRKVRPVI